MWTNVDIMPTGVVTEVDDDERETTTQATRAALGLGVPWQTRLDY